MNPKQILIFFLLFRKIYDNNLNALLDILDLMHSMEKHKPILQLKPSTIMPAKTLVCYTYNMLFFSRIVQ